MVTHGSDADFSYRGISTHPSTTVNTGMDDEFFWNDDYNIISRIAAAIRDDLAKVEMKKDYAEMWRICSD